MFPFFNKDKQNTNINNMNKQEIMTKIEGVKAKDAKMQEMVAEL